MKKKLFDWHFLQRKFASIKRFFFPVVPVVTCGPGPGVIDFIEAIMNIQDTADVSISEEQTEEISIMVLSNKFDEAISLIESLSETPLQNDKKNEVMSLLREVKSSLKEMGR